MNVSQGAQWGARTREHNADRVPFPLKCREMQRPRLQDLPYCRHMALRWDTVFVRVCVQAEKLRERAKGEGIRVSHIGLPQGSLGNYREAGQLHQLCFFGTCSMVKCRRRDLLLPFCHYVSRLMIVYFYCPAFGIRPERAKGGQQCWMWKLFLMEILKE